jgi:hypothetical protein
MNAPRAALGLALSLSMASACQPQDPCAPAGTACGGDPSGVWGVANGCREPIYQPALPTTYDQQPATMARQPPPEPTSSDWCSYLVYDANMGKITSFIFPHDALPLGEGGTVTYASDGTFGAILSTPGYGQADLSASCLERFGAFPSCADVTTKLATFAGPDGSYHDIACSDDGGGGCLCTYRISFNPSGGSLSGRWSTSDTLLTHFSSGFRLPSQADYCVDAGGGTMTLWAHDQTDLWDQPGLRTVVLQRM